MEAQDNRPPGQTPEISIETTPVPAEETEEINIKAGEWKNQQNRARNKRKSNSHRAQHKKKGEGKMNTESVDSQEGSHFISKDGFAVVNRKRNDQLLEN